MPVEIQWISHASFRIAGDEAVVYIDPWKLPDAPHDADVVIVSHSHHDHCSPDDIAKISKADTALIAPAETIKILHVANAVAPGECMTIKGVTIEAVAAYNVGKRYHPQSNHWIGAVVTIDGKRVYYAGDTDLTDEMSDLKDVDVALLPVGGTYTLDAREAAKAAETIGCRAVVPYHWGDIVGSADDAVRFAELVKCCTVHVLEPGQKMTL